MPFDRAADHPNPKKNGIKTTRLSQSMIASRYNQFDTNPSPGIDRLDLAVTNEQLAKAKALLNAPIGLPLKTDISTYYKDIVDHFIVLLSSTLAIKPTPKNITQHLKTFCIAGVRADHFLDIIPTHNKNEIAVRIWMQMKNTHPANLVSRVLLFVTRPIEQKITQPILFLQQFGNVDLCLIPTHLLTEREPAKSSTQQPPICFGLEAEIKVYLSPKDFITISHYLDHGQTLNLSKLKNLGFDDLSEPLPNQKNTWQVADPYQQYLNDISHYAATTFNGSLIARSVPAKLQLLHLTPYKTEIIASQELRVSRAGCIGSMVYTTLIVGDSSNTIGGHTIGLCNRLSCLPNNNNLILLELDQTGNQITNWIEKLGRGRLFLEAKNRIVSNGIYKNSANKLQFTTFSPNSFRKHAFKINRISSQAVEMYNRCWELLFFCSYYSRNIRPSGLNNTSQYFLKLSNLLTQVGKQINGQPYYSIFNSILFETIKDYILLFQSDNESKNYRDVHSFNMHMQYQIFFELFPQLKTAWNTNLFPMDIPNILKTLERWEFFTHEDDKNLFMQFFLNRFAYYINVGVLEGSTILPIPDQSNSFDSLSNQLPNLMGNIFNTLIKQYKKSALLECYMEHLRSCYELSYDTRNIHVAIKSGVCGTDEVGVRPETNIGFFNVAITERNSLFTISKTTPINLAIGGASEQSGFTDRGPEMRQITLEHLHTPSLNLTFIGQNILEKYYLKPFKPSTIDRSQDPKHFEVKSLKIPRVTHGAMHAARVMIYIKIIHNFRLEQQDPMINGLIDFANSQNISPIALLHLTQLAAIFHDSARLDEGSDRWDKESAINCLNFFSATFPELKQNLAQLIANTITFKDDEVSFLTTGEAMGFTKLQMGQVNYLRQLIHDADCLDIMRVKSTFKTQFLEMKARVNPDNLLDFVQNILKLIHRQKDQYKTCKIQHNDRELDAVPAAFNIDHKCTYEWSPNIIQAVLTDMSELPEFKTVFLPWTLQQPPDELTDNCCPKITKTH